MAAANARSLEVGNFIFFQMHAVPCDYEKRDPADVMPLDEVREGLKSLNVLLGTFYDRPPASLPSAGGNSAFANGTGAASFIRKEQIMTPVKLLCRLRQFKEVDFDTPVFFFAYRNYEKKLAKTQEVLMEEGMIIKDDPEYKVNHLLYVTLGGLFILKSRFADVFIRVRITKILLETRSLQYWAVDEAFFGNCEPQDLLFVNQRLVELNMLAVPGIFETDPKPAQLARFEGDGHPYCMVRVSQPKYSNDIGPRKISFM